MNKKCQIFTPEDYVEELLDTVGYTEKLYGKKILENSCGDGKILIGIVQRYILDCRNRGFSNTKIRNGLSNDIFGVEIDTEQYKKCLDNLNQTLSENGIVKIKWNIKNEDYLNSKDETLYQYIVGNPPYITYKEMDTEDQIKLKQNYNSCKKGKFDYCYAFIEKSINSLDTNGRMSYLIPSSIFKTVFGANLRAEMKPYVESIRDYTQEKMFNNALVKSAIVVLSKDRTVDEVHYVDVSMNSSLDIQTALLKNKWVFAENIGNGNRRFGDYFKVSHAVATLLNAAYVLKDGRYIAHNQYIECEGCNIESEVVRDTAAPRSLRYNKNEKIIFPYTYENNLLRRYTAEEFAIKFPEATKYLNKFRDELDKRKSDDSLEWFEYGRSQALSKLNSEKLLISTVITTELQVYNLPQECIPYAGMYIIPRDDNDDITLERAETILRDRRFMQYVLDVGIHISGNSLRITSKDVENYRF